ncbi:hypothetical protein SI65_03558 [Aspergillus cristatus]|uniref:Uncharacterized protein n=1 Tax=Aspergillus cristatus TaxID=573508 RepID=A0A1E3BHS0_ASPCR|nr:hypothetical protein SI65_03558 [Aspergillus cristatus]
MRFLRPLSFILPLLSTALADVEFTAPAFGSTLKGGHVVTAHWKESGELLRISQLLQYDIHLCAGGDTSDSYEELATLIKDAPFARGNSVSFKIDQDVGGEEANAYFLKLVASGPDVSVINYSSRFSLTDMTGSFSPRVADGIHSIRNISGAPLREDQEHEGFQKRQAVGAPAAAATGLGAHTIPYELQTGLTWYAPMAKRPGKTIPPGKPTPQHPTSHYSIATAYLGAPTVQTTVSATDTYKVTNVENTATPAAQPEDMNMKRWLERWKD